MEWGSNGGGNSSSMNMMVGFGVVGEGKSTNRTNGLWSSQPHQQGQGMMMMMMMPSTTTQIPAYYPHPDHQNHDDPPLPPLPPSTANFNGGADAADGGSCSQSQTSFLMGLGTSLRTHENLKANNDSYSSSVGVGYYFMNPTTTTTTTTTNHDAGDGSGSIKAKIMAHPHYPRLLSTYVNCQKVGAPPEVVKRLEDAAEAVGMGVGGGSGYIGEDPALDQFMEAYCEMLTKYEQELTKPFKEAMVFLSKIECQFKALSLSSSSFDPAPAAYGDTVDRTGSPEEEIDVNANFVDPEAEDRELKCQLLRKYSGYLGSLKQEFMKKRKKGKLPKEARQQLLDWWTRHYKWPYPSESQKLALAEATGLDQKQINNWFINQRKRHWKPSEDMQFVVMDSSHHLHPHYYMENVLGNPYPMDLPPALL